ncbi:MAG: cell division protein FtsZ, partial [Corynebacterium sp.]|nr:cell division protein FtsZ [Corynebacterium sp.]
AAQPVQDDYSPRHSYEPRAGQEREHYTPQRPAEERRPESSGLFTNSDRFSREERRDDYRLSRPSQRRDDDGDDDLDVPSFMR